MQEELNYIGKIIWKSSWVEIPYKYNYHRNTFYCKSFLNVKIVFFVNLLFCARFLSEEDIGIQYPITKEKDHFIHIKNNYV